MASGSGGGGKRGKGTSLRSRTAASARRMQAIMQSAGSGAPF